MAADTPEILRSDDERFIGACLEATGVRMHVSTLAPEGQYTLLLEASVNPLTSTDGGVIIVVHPNDEPAGREFVNHIVGLRNTKPYDA